MIVLKKAQLRGSENEKVVPISREMLKKAQLRISEYEKDVPITKTVEGPEL